MNTEELLVVYRREDDNGSVRVARVWLDPTLA
jgi:hypothetical protein